MTNPDRRSDMPTSASHSDSPSSPAMSPTADQAADQAAHHTAQAFAAPSSVTIPAAGTVLTDGTVKTTVAEGIGRIEFFHPKGNSLPGALLGELAAAVTQMGEDDNVRVILISSGGSGPFCAGASFDELMAIGDVAVGQEFFSGFARVILAMIRAPKFVVTLVHGKAAGGAVGVIAASDYSIATNNASAKLSELAIGIGPFVVGPVIERKIGLSAFSGMAVDADWRDAAWCERHGLYTQIVEDTAALVARGDQLATTLAASNPEAMAHLKTIFWEGTQHWALVLDDRAAMSGRMVLSDFTRAAITKFRAPR